MSKESIINKLNDFITDNNISKNELKDLLSTQEKIEKETIIQNEVNKNKSLIGKCFVHVINRKNSLFPEMKRFYKIVSNRSDNEYRVECLYFDEHPTYWFDYQAHLMSSPGDYYFGHFNFQSFETNSFMTKEITTFTEISIEEFNHYAKQYLNELLELNWYADHHRWGNILPTDPKWPEKEKSPIHIENKTNRKD